MPIWALGICRPIGLDASPWDEFIGFLVGVHGDYASCSIISSSTSSSIGVNATPIVLSIVLSQAYSSLNNTSLLMMTFLVSRLYNLYALECSPYPRELHFSFLSSNFFLNFLGTCAYATHPKTLICVMLKAILVYASCGTLFLTLLVGYMLNNDRRCKLFIFPKTHKISVFPSTYSFHIYDGFISCIFLCRFAKVCTLWWTTFWFHVVCNKNECLRIILSLSIWP